MKINLHTSVTARDDYVGIHYIIDEWDKLGFINRVQIPRLSDGRYISWVGGVGTLALEPSNIEAISTPYEYVLACQYQKKWGHLSKVLPWNFYPRYWPEYKIVMNEPPRERTIKSFFSGTIRGTAHERVKWIGSTEVFHHKRAGTWRGYNNAYPSFLEYYRALASSKFGLCPMGDVGVCQREIETPGMGAVPIFTPNVEYQYYVPPVENVHFILANDPAEMNLKINSMSNEQWQFMSNNCKEYFKKYVTPTGLWNTVLETVEKKNIKI